MGAVYVAVGLRCRKEGAVGLRCCRMEEAFLQLKVSGAVERRVLHTAEVFRCSKKEGAAYS